MRTIIWGNDFDTVNEQVEMYKETGDTEDFVDYTEEDFYDLVYASLELDFADLEDTFDKNVGDIITIGELGLWDGKKLGYRLDGNNLSNVLKTSSDGYLTFGLDDTDFIGKEVHHDGTNHYTYRVFKEDISELDQEKFLDNIYYGKVTEQEIDEFTTSLKPVVDKLLGFN